MDLLSFFQLGAGGTVGIDQAVAAEGVIIAIGIDPVAAVAPEFIHGAIFAHPNGADGLVDVVPDKAALGAVVGTDGVPVFQGVAVGLAHGVVIFGVDEGHSAAVTGDIVGQDILGGVHVHDVILTDIHAPGILTVGLHIGMLIVFALALVLAQAAGVAGQQIHGGHPEAVVIIEGRVAVSRLVAQRPDHHGGVVLIALGVGGHAVQHGRHPFRQALTGTGGHLDAAAGGGMALDVGLGTDINAQLVGQIIEDLVVGIVGGADGVEVILLHQGQVGEVVLIVERMTGLQIGVVAVDAAEDHLAAGDLHLLVTGGVDVDLVDLTEADPLHHGLHDLAGAVLQLQHQGVQVGGVGEPLGGVFHIHLAGDGGTLILEHFLGGLGSRRGNIHSLILSLSHGLAAVIHNIGGNGVVARFSVVQTAEGGVHRDGDIAVLVSPVIKLRVEEEVPNLHLVLGVEVHIAIDTALTDEVLVLQPAADGPAEDLQSDGVLFPVGVEVVGNVKVVSGKAVSGIAHGLAVHIEIISGLHALEGDEDLTTIPVFRRGKGGAVVAHRVVHRGGLRIAIVQALPFIPGEDLVGIHGLVILKGTVLVAVGLPRLRHVFRLERIAGILLRQVFRIYLGSRLGVGDHGKIPILAG